MTHTDITHGDPSPEADHPASGFAQRLCPLDLAELFALDIKPRGMVIEPIIPEKGGSSPSRDPTS